MEISLKYKVGDKFMLPGNDVYTGIYTVIEIEWGYIDANPVFWAIFEDGMRRWSGEERMQPATKLHLALK